MSIITDPERDPVVRDGRPYLAFTSSDGEQLEIDRTWAVRAVFRDSIVLWPLRISPELDAFLAGCDLDGSEPHDALILHARREVQL
jgi:hypothetical protein